MKLVVFSNSRPFERYLEGNLQDDFGILPQLQAPEPSADRVYLLHMTSMKPGGFEWLSKHAEGHSLAVGVCSDVPSIEEMLECVRLGARAYCNSHMAVDHYRQMLRLLRGGQSWFPPRMIEQAFLLAQNALHRNTPEELLQCLTPRERDVALAMAEGRTNRQIADRFSVKEATVKTHVTNIFKKLEVRNRTALVSLLKQS